MKYGQFKVIISIVGGVRLEIYCSSSFIDKCETLTTLLQKYKEYSNNIVFILDTNLCILFREFYNSPLKFKIKKEYKESYQIIKKLHSMLYLYRNNIICALAIDESSRTLDDFSLNHDKQRNANIAVQYLLQMNPYQFEKFALTVKPSNEIKDSSQKSNSKINALKQDIPYIEYLRVIYVCMLKLYLLKRINSENICKYKEFLDFIDKEIDLTISQVTAFAVFYVFDEYGSIKKILDKKGAKSFSEVLHNIWNASIDMYFITFTRMLVTRNELPVLVTSDKNLYKLDSMMKYLRISFDEKGNVFPESHEIGLFDNLDFLKPNERTALLELNNNFVKSRKLKGKTRNPYDDSILDICKQLEDELEVVLEKSQIIK
jgi:hypothetical protein